VIVRGRRQQVQTVRVARVPELAARRALLLSFLITALVSALFATLPVDGSTGSVTALSAALTISLASAFLARAPRPTRVPSRIEVSPDAPARDERCRRGSFRRQTSPAAPGRVLPRAPQPA
jgi:hypothetical protein